MKLKFVKAGLTHSWVSFKLQGLGQFGMGDCIPVSDLNLHSSVLFRTVVMCVLHEYLAENY